MKESHFWIFFPALSTTFAEGSLPSVPTVHGCLRRRSRIRPVRLDTDQPHVSWRPTTASRPESNGSQQTGSSDNGYPVWSHQATAAGTLLRDYPWKWHQQRMTNSKSCNCSAGVGNAVGSAGSRAFSEGGGKVKEGPKAGGRRLDGGRVLAVPHAHHTF